MKILSLSHVVDTDEVSFDDDTHFCTLDYSGREVIDFYFHPLMFLEEFRDTKAELSVGDHRVGLPLDWSILCGDPDVGMTELIPLTHINGRRFDVVTYNPFTSYMPSLMRMDLVNVYPNMEWVVPKLEVGQMLLIPLHAHSGAPCIIATNQKLSKLPDAIDISWAF